METCHQPQHIEEDERLRSQSGVSTVSSYRAGRTEAGRLAESIEGRGIGGFPLTDHPCFPLDGRCAGTRVLHEPSHAAGMTARVNATSATDSCRWAPGVAHRHQCSMPRGHHDFPTSHPIDVGEGVRRALVPRPGPRASLGQNLDRRLPDLRRSKCIPRDRDACPGKTSIATDGVAHYRRLQVPGSDESIVLAVSLTS